MADELKQVCWSWEKTKIHTEHEMNGGKDEQPQEDGAGTKGHLEASMV